jgi:two-component system, NtrC family, response regulator AtoC
MKTVTRRMHHIAVLYSEPAVLSYVGDVLSDRYKVSRFSRTEEFNQALDEGASFDIVVMDWVRGNDSEADAPALLGRIRAFRPALPVVVLACSADLEDIITATRIGAAEILFKPLCKSNIDEAVQRCLDTLSPDSCEEEIREIPLDENTSFVRSTKRMREIESQCTLVARADIPVLILGESGTGKEVAAMLIHKMSSRGNGNFLKVNCVAMPAELLESELFGYEPGAFTGAIKPKPGKFELCDKGTIFLDEIGEMPVGLQAKLLQVLQDGSFSRLGGRSTIRVDVRVIAATNIDIKKAIAEKRFREDLYYRLNGFTIKMPPLRERKQEIPILSGHFMRKAVAKYGCEPLPISQSLMQSLACHSWPGNVRELENTIKRYLVLRDEKPIIGELAPLNMFEALTTGSEARDDTSSLKVLVKSLKRNAEAVAIAQSLESTGWNRKVAANDLRISYKALLYKIKQYNLSPPSREQVFNSLQAPRAS